MKHDEQQHARTKRAGGDTPRAIVSTESERRAILSVADSLIGRAGRTTLALGLRGSHARRVLQYGLETTSGHGFFAGVPEPEVLARIDALIAEGILAIEHVDGYPLLRYSARGLALAKEYAADNWFETVRAQVSVVAGGAPLALPFLMSVMPQRNHETVFLVVDRIAREADASWMPLLRAWSAAETRRVRQRLEPIIARLEGAG